MSDTATRRRIRAQPSAGDPSIMGFVLDEAIQNGPPVTFAAAGSAPLAAALFALDGVVLIEVSGATIWVKRHAEAEWATLKPAIADAIRRVLDEADCSVLVVHVR